MKKIALAFIGLLLSQSIVHAEMAGYQKVPADRIDSYKEAIRQAIGDLRIESDCLNNSILNGAQEIYLQKTSNQPLIIAVFKGSAKALSMIYTSDASFKKIINVQQKLTMYTSATVNMGDLRNPEMVVQTTEKNQILECVN